MLLRLSLLTLGSIFSSPQFPFCCKLCSHTGYFRFFMYLFKEAGQSSCCICLPLFWVKGLELGGRQSENWPVLQGRLLGCYNKEGFTLWHCSVAQTCTCSVLILLGELLSVFLQGAFRLFCLVLLAWCIMYKTLNVTVIEFVFFFFLIAVKTQSITFTILTSLGVQFSNVEHIHIVETDLQNFLNL